LINCKDCGYNKNRKCTFLKSNPPKGKCCINDVFLKGHGWVNPEMEGLILRAIDDLLF